MNALIALLSFILGFSLGKRPLKKRLKYRFKRSGEVIGIKDFLSYDGSEQTK